MESKVNLNSIRFTTRELAKLLDCTDTSIRQNIYRNKLRRTKPNKRAKVIYISGIDFAKMLCNNPISRRRWIRVQKDPIMRIQYGQLINAINQYICSHECLYLPKDIADLYDLPNSDPVRYLIRIGKIQKDPKSRYLTLREIRDAVMEHPELRYYFSKEVNLL